MENIFLGLALLSLGLERVIGGYPSVITTILCLIAGVLILI